MDFQEREEQECKCMPSGILHAFSTDCFLRSTSITAAGNSKSLASAFTIVYFFARCGWWLHPLSIKKSLAPNRCSQTTFSITSPKRRSATRESNINNPREGVIVIEIQTFKDLSVKAGYGLRAVGLPSGHDLHSSCDRWWSP